MTTNVIWQHGEVTRADREKLLKQKGFSVWLTGISGSGKSTIAVALEKALYLRKIASYRLDGDNVRLGINKDLGFTEIDRRENIRRIGEVSNLMADAGIVTIASFISPFARDRAEVRKVHKINGLAFMEVHIDCSLEVAEQRDPKGLYKLARAGEIKNFTAIDHPYEKPTQSDVHLNTEIVTVETSVDRIVEYMINQCMITPKI